MVTNDTGYTGRTVVTVLVVGLKETNVRGFMTGSINYTPPRGLRRFIHIYILLFSRRCLWPTAVRLWETRQDTSSGRRKRPTGVNPRFRFLQMLSLPRPRANVQFSNTSCTRTSLRCYSSYRRFNTMGRDPAWSKANGFSPTNDVRNKNDKVITSINHMGFPNLLSVFGPNENRERRSCLKDTLRRKYL